MVYITSVYSQEYLEDVLTKGTKVIRCPICGNEALDDCHICPHCNWEDDPFMHRGYSCANSSFKLLYKLRYKLRNLFKHC